MAGHVSTPTTTQFLSVDPLISVTYGTLIISAPNISANQSSKALPQLERPDGAGIQERTSK
jgi:hypothetical protein